MESMQKLERHREEFFLFFSYNVGIVAGGHVSVGSINDADTCVGIGVVVDACIDVDSWVLLL